MALTLIYSRIRPLFPLATPSGAGEADFHRKGSQVCAGERLIVLGLVPQALLHPTMAAKQMMKRENL